MYCYCSRAVSIHVNNLRVVINLASLHIALVYIFGMQVYLCIYCFGIYRPFPQCTPLKERAFLSWWHAYHVAVLICRPSPRELQQRCDIERTIRSDCPFNWLINLKPYLSWAVYLILDMKPLRPMPTYFSWLLFCLYLKCVATQ